MKIPCRRTPEPPKLSRPKADIDAQWGEMDSWGMKTLGDGTSWVLHCLTGEPLERKAAQPLRAEGGRIFWVKKGERLSALDAPRDFKWGNP